MTRAWVVDSSTRVRTPSASAEGKHPGMPMPEGTRQAGQGLQALVLDCVSGQDKAMAARTILIAAWQIA